MKQIIRHAAFVAASVAWAVCAFADTTLTPSTIHDDIPGTATIGEIVAAGGGGGGGSGVNTNVVKSLINSEVGGTNAVKTTVATVTANAASWSAKAETTITNGLLSSSVAQVTYQPIGNYVTPSVATGITEYVISTNGFLKSFTERDPTVGLTNDTVYASGTNRTFLTSHQSLAWSNDYRRITAKINWSDVTNRDDVATKQYADQYANQAPGYGVISNKAMTALQEHQSLSVTNDYRRKDALVPWNEIGDKPTFKPFTTNANEKIQASDIADGVIPSGVTISNIVTNVVTKSYVESLGISGGADTNEVNALIRSYDETNLTARINNARPSDYTTTNAVKSIVNAQFSGGTDDVNRVVVSFGGVSNRVGIIEASTNVWNAKQDAINQAGTNAITSGITAEKVATYEGYATNKADKIELIAATNAIPRNLITDGTNTVMANRDCVTIRNGLSEWKLHGQLATYSELYEGHGVSTNGGWWHIDCSGGPGLIWLKEEGAENPYIVNPNALKLISMDSSIGGFADRTNGYLEKSRLALTNDIPTKIAWANVTNTPTFKSFTTNESVKISSSDIATGVIPTIAATDPTFSNAVLAVGLNIDTNSVAVLNEIAATFGGFPIAGTTTTVGGLLAALAAAIAWLRKKKIDKITCSGVADITTENGTANVSDLFTSANTSLTSTIGSTIAARCQSLDPANSSISDVIKALKGIN